MSEFDEEAERERLREKFEDDRRKRESTQHMSELLLKGATMTNRHCEACSDPIFRYEGQEFCPTCQRSADEGDNAAPAAPDENAEPSADAVEVTPETDDESDPADAGADADRAADEEPLGAASGATPGDGRASAPGSPSRSGARSTPERRTADESVDAARASLVRTLTRFARAAEECDDPRRAADHLAAAREAAETLSALER